MKTTLVIVLMAAFFAADAQKKTPPKKTTTPTGKVLPVFKNSVDSFSYAIGLEGASYYRNQGAEQINPDMVKKAFEDVYGNKTLLLTPEQTNMNIQQRLQEFAANKMKAAKA